MIIVNRIAVDGPTCTIWTEGGRFERWPGRTIDTGQQWWAWLPTDGRNSYVTVPETIALLESAFLDERSRLVEASIAQHPSNRPRRPHLTVVRAS